MPTFFLKNAIIENVIKSIYLFNPDYDNIFRTKNDYKRHFLYPRIRKPFSWLTHLPQGIQTIPPSEIPIENCTRALWSLYTPQCAWKIAEPTHGLIALTQCPCAPICIGNKCPGAIDHTRMIHVMRSILIHGSFRVSAIRMGTVFGWFLQGNYFFCRIWSGVWEFIELLAVEYLVVSDWIVDESLWIYNEKSLRGFCFWFDKLKKNTRMKII